MDLFCPVEMDHEQMAVELRKALGRKIVFRDLPIEGYTASLTKMRVPAYVVQHFAGAMLHYQNGHMAGANKNVEKFTARRSMTVGEFAKLHADQLNAS